MNPNQTTFCLELEKAYTDLFTSDPAYAYVSSRHTPKALAITTTRALSNGNANMDGEGIKRACKAVGIKQTRKATIDFLK